MALSEKKRRAGIAARLYLEMRGFSIIEQNFRRPYCEVDIIAQKDDTVHFVEVYFGADDQLGSGIGFSDFLHTKVSQMRLAPRVWAEETKWRGGVVSSAIEIDGASLSVMNYVENAF
jgi:putative endonuclease